MKKMKKSWKSLLERVEYAHKISVETQKAAMDECSRAWSLKEVTCPSIRIAQQQFGTLWGESKELRFTVEKVGNTLVSKLKADVLIEHEWIVREVSIGQLDMDDLVYLVPKIQTVKGYTEGLIDEMPPSDWFPTEKTNEDK